MTAVLGLYIAVCIDNLLHIIFSETPCIQIQDVSAHEFILKKTR